MGEVLLGFAVLLIAPILTLWIMAVRHHWRVPPPNTARNADYLRAPDGWRGWLPQAAATTGFALAFCALWYLLLVAR